MGSPRLIAMLAAAALLAVGSDVRADDKSADTVAIVTLRIGGDADPGLRYQLQESIRRGLAAAKLQTVTHDQVRKALRNEPDLVECTSSTCLQQLGTLVGARRFLRARVDGKGAAYEIEVELLASGGKTARRLEQSCAVCTITELNELVATSTEELVSAVPTNPVAVAIVTRPQGGTLRIDGKDVGAAPFSGKLAPGNHDISALLPGHLEAEQTIEVTAEADGSQRFEVILSPIAITKPPPAPARPYRLWKWLAAGGAGAALVTSIVLIAINGNGTCDLTGTQDECPDIYNTLVPGLLSAGLSIGLGGASGWMFLRDDKAGRRERAAIIPTRGGAVAGFSLAF